MRSWTAQLYESGATAGVSVPVSPGPAGLDAGAEVWPWPQVEQLQGYYPGEPVRLRNTTSGLTLVLADRSLIDACTPFAPHVYQKVRDGAWRASLALLAGVGLAIIVVPVVLFFAAVPWLTDQAARLIPVSWEERIGEASANQVAPERSRCTDPEVQEAVEQIVRKLRIAAPAHPYQFRVTVTQNDMVNALAAPGGYIVVFTGLLRQTDSPEELAGVLAHEMQHVFERHSMQGIVREVGLAALFAIAFGDASAMGAATALSNLKFGRDAETTADTKGLELLERAGVDPRGMIAFFRKLSKQSPETPRMLNYLSTHPRTEDRIAELERMARPNLTTRPVLEGVDWTRVKARCR